VYEGFLTTSHRKPRLIQEASASEVVQTLSGPERRSRAETALMPAGLSFDQVGTVTNVRRRDDNHVTVKAFTTKTLDESTVLIQEAVTAAGYRFTGMDSEGNEAEVFFNSGSVAAGLALVRQSACADRWDIDLTLLDRPR
jgi:hypothetical protein